jgi:hypothetical protein
MLQGNWDLVVGWVQVPGVGEVEAAHLQECRNGGISSGRRRIQCRTHWLHVAPRKFEILDHHTRALVPSGARDVLLKSKLP